jgi:hypothetical protein
MNIAQSQQDVLANIAFKKKLAKVRARMEQLAIERAAKRNNKGE